MSEITREFIRIIFNEARMTKNPWNVPSASEVTNIAHQIKEVAKSSLEPRSYNRIYGLSKNEYAFESVGAHTNLVSVLIDRALSFYYKSEEDLKRTGYTYREIMEAVRLHDLPENFTGDIPDNGSGDTQKKKSDEKLYFDVFFSTYSPKEEQFMQNVHRLLNEMEQKSSEMGKLLYCADKAAAVLITLEYDENGTPPLLKISRKANSERDLEEMSLCDNKEHNRCHASEMWTVDWFKARNLIDFDTTGFFTSLIIMRTLQVNGHWYKWRENDYH